MKSMKLSPKEATAEAMPMPSKPEYPWGLCLRLNEETIAKLGLDKLPEVGKQVSIQAVGEVVSVSMNQYADQKQNRCLELQVTELGVGPYEEPKMDAGAALYGGTKEGA